MPKVQSMLPEIIYVRVVGNDLADDVSGHTFDSHLHQAMACIVGQWANTVMVGSAMHRQCVRGKMSVQEYNDRVDKFNSGMKWLLYRGDVPMHGDLDILCLSVPNFCMVL